MSSSPAPEGDAETIRRASGRVRKQPETMYTSSPYTNGNKRKRCEQDADGDHAMPDDYDSDDDLPEEDEEPDEEELREKRARARKTKSAAVKKPATKKSKTNGTTTLPIRPAGGGRKRAPKKAKQLDTLDAEEAGGIFADVFAHSEDLQKIATEWRKSFNENESIALADIINFTLKAAGCNGKVTNHDIEDPDAVTSRIMDLQDEYQASNPTDYPLMAKGKYATSIKQGVNGFLDVLIKSIASDKLLYNNPELIENIQVWFSTMSSAANRPFRHTATVVSMGIITSLCEVARDVADSASKDRRQAETERKKGAKANKGRIQQLEQKAKDSSQFQEFTEALLKDWFDSVFVHRYRDIDATIRRECVTALGDWIIKIPAVFFDGSHLRYMGWLLSDTAPTTRGEVLKQLIRLYKMPDMIGGLKTFTERFRSRIVEIATSDAESSARASGVELLDLLRENGLLEPDDIDAVGRLVFDSDPKVRKTVASFLAESIKELYDSKIDDIGGLEALEESLPEVGDDNFEVPRLQWLKLKCLAEVLQAYDSEESLPSQVERTHGDGGLTLLAAGADSRFTLAAGVLYDFIEEARDWRMLAGYLLFDHTSGKADGVSDDALAQLKREASLTDAEEIVLLEVLNTSLKRGLTDATEKAASAKTKLTKKQKAELEEEQEDAAAGLAEIIPKMLQKFGDNPDTAAAVLRLESIFSLPSLQDLQHDSNRFSALLDDIRKQFMAHGSDNVLEPASNAILHAKSYGELDELTAEKIMSLWDDVVRNFAELIDPATFVARGVADYESLEALSNNLLRIIRLSSVSDCTLPLEDESILSVETGDEELKAPIDYILALVQRAISVESSMPEPDEASMEDRICVRAAEAGLFYFRWKLKSIVERVTTVASADIPYEELEALASRRDRFDTLLNSVLSSRKAGDDVCAAIAGYTLDLYASATTLKTIKARAGVSDDYTVLIMEFDANMEKALLKVFSATEKNFARLSNRKLEEAPVGNGNANEGNDDDDDPINDDPISDPESDDEDDEPTQTQTQAHTQASLQRREAKMLKTLLAEQRLCELTSKIIMAVLGGIMNPTRTRKRIERNKTRLGPNFKEVCAYFDIEGVQAKKTRAKGGAKGKAKGKPTAAVIDDKGKKNAKSNAIVAEDEEDDDIEDPEADDEETMRKRGLHVEEDPDDAGEEEEAVNDAGAEEESVLGD